MTSFADINSKIFFLIFSFYNSQYLLCAAIFVLII